MKTKSLLILLTAGLCLSRAEAAEVSYQAIVISGQPAPDLGPGTNLSTLDFVSLGNDGRIAFASTLSGPDLTFTNGQAVWAGVPGDFHLLARTGDPAPGSGWLSTFQFHPPAISSDSQSVASLADLFVTGFGGVSFSPIFGYQVYHDLAGTNFDLQAALDPETMAAVFAGQNVTAIAGRANLSGPDVGYTNDAAIVVGPPDALEIVARAGSPAPGTSGSFQSFSLDSQALALAPDGRVLFSGTVGGKTSGSGVWFGKANALQTVAFPGSPAPDSLLGPGFTFYGAGSDVDVNARGEVVFATILNGPGLNDTNDFFLVAGPPDALRVVAQSGQPAPGVSGAVLNYFGPTLIGSDGSVAFEATYTGSSNAFGLWLAPTNGTPLLIARNGMHAPGMPAGIVYADTTLSGTPPFTGVFLNGRNQIAFGAEVTGPGIGYTNNTGIWLAEPDGSVNLIVRSGEMFDVLPGEPRQLDNVLFDLYALPGGGPEDGHRWHSPFNDRGDLVFWATWEWPPYPSPLGLTGYILARQGIFLTGDRLGNEIHLRFPTLNGKHYRVDDKTNLSAPTWSVAVQSVVGTGGEVTVTNSVGNSSQAEFYRVVRTD